MQITIGGKPVVAMAGSLDIDDAIGERSTAQFAVHSEPGVHYQQGQPVAVYNHVPGTPSALAFAGDDWVEIPSANILPHMTQLGNYTVETWVNVVPGPTAQAIFNLGPTDNRHGAAIDAGLIRFGRYNGTEGYVRTTSFISAGWHHVAMINNNGVMSLVIDGEQGIPQGGSMYLGTLTSTLFIGRNASTNLNYFSGSLDDFRIWDHVRTADQIRANMNRELVGNEPGLVGYWKFNEPGINPVTANFVGKVSGSTVANPHLTVRATATTLLAPSAGGTIELTSGQYGQISALDGDVFVQSHATSGGIDQMRFSFDLIQLAIRERGVPLNTMTTAEAVAWLKANVREIIGKWWGFGSGPSGNNASFAWWNSASWASPTNHTNGSVHYLWRNIVTSIPAAIDANGFVHFLAYAEASNGTTASTINTDYVELYVEFVNTAIDSSGNGNNGTIIGASYTTDAPELKTPELIFAGLIDKPVERLLRGEHGKIAHSISCKDWHYLADKRIVAKAYSLTAAGDIVTDLIATRLADEGITAGVIEDGPIINEAVFNYVQVSKALDRLAEKAGFVWYVDFDRTLHFRARAHELSPWEVTGADILAGVQVEHGNVQYRNTQYIKGGTDITDPQTQSFKGDGTIQSFALGFKVAKVPTITVNGAAQTVGIRGLDEGKQWYWNKGDVMISQDTEATPLTSAQTITITYQGEFAIVAISKDGAEVVSRQTLELNSGIVEDVRDEPETTNRQAAFESAAALLKRYAIIGRRIKFRTFRGGLQAGQVATVTLLEHALDGSEMLIESVGVSEDAENVFYDVSAVEGPELGSWTRMFERLANRGEAFVIRENISEDEILVTLEQFDESMTWGEGWTNTVYACPIPNTTLYPSTTLYPC